MTPAEVATLANAETVTERLVWELVAQDFDGRWTSDRPPPPTGAQRHCWTSRPWEEGGNVANERQVMAVLRMERDFGRSTVTK